MTMQTIDPASLDRATAIAMREESARQSELARIAAGLSKGARKRQYLAIAKAHHANCMALSDAIDGPCGASLTDAELLAELLA